MANQPQQLFKVFDIGAMGVNVDADPISLEDQELRQAQNAIRDPLGADSGLRKRPGFQAIALTDPNGAILGGTNLPLKDLSAGGTHYIYIGRGPL